MYFRSVRSVGVHFTGSSPHAPRGPHAGPQREQQRPEHVEAHLDAEAPGAADQLASAAGAAPGLDREGEQELPERPLLGAGGEELEPAAARHIYTRRASGSSRPTTRSSWWRSPRASSSRARRTAASGLPSRAGPGRSRGTLSPLGAHRRSGVQARAAGRGAPARRGPSRRERRADAVDAGSRSPRGAPLAALPRGLAGIGTGTQRVPSTASGSQVAIPGNAHSSTTEAAMRPTNGMTPHTTSFSGMSGATFLMTKMLSPTGGWMSPISMTTVITTPNQTRSNPAALRGGRTIGAVIRMIETGGRKNPSITTNSRIVASSTQRERCIGTIHSAADWLR